MLEKEVLLNILQIRVTLFTIFDPMICVINPKASSAGAFAINFIVYLLMRTLFNHIFSHIVFL